MGRRHEEDPEEIGAAAAKAPTRRRSNPSIDNDDDNNNNNNNNSIYHPPTNIDQEATTETPYPRYEPAPPPPLPPYAKKKIPGQDTQQGSGSAPVATRRGNEVSHQIRAARLPRSIDAMEDDGDNHSENNSTIISNSDLPGAFNVEGNAAHPIDDGTIQYSMGAEPDDASNVGEMSRRRAESPPPEEGVGITENRNLVVAELAPTTIEGTVIRMEDKQQQPPSSSSYKKFVILLLSAILVCVVTGVIVVIILLVPSDDEGTESPTIVTSATPSTLPSTQPSTSPSTQPSTSPSTQPSTILSPGPISEEFIGLVVGAEMTLYGIDDFDSSSVDEWETLTSDFTDMFWSGDDTVNLIVTAINVTQVISNRRHLKGRALQDDDDESVTLVYSQGFIYETEAPDLINPRLLASLQFSAGMSREEYRNLLVESGDEGLVNITQTSAVSLPAEPDVDT